MRIQQLIISVFVLWLVSLFTGPAIAQAQGGNPSAALNGTYAFNSSLTCTQTPGGFTPPASPGLPFLAVGTSANVHLALTGVTTYDGQGGATTTENGIFLFPEPVANGAAVVSPFNETCTWTYQLNGSTVSVVGNCTATDNSYRVTNIHYTGQIRGTEITTVQAEPHIQTLEIPAFGSVVSYRICAGIGIERRQ